MCPRLQHPFSRENCFCGMHCDIHRQWADVSRRIPFISPGGFWPSTATFNRRCNSGRLTAPRSAHLPSFHPRLASRMRSKSSKPKCLASTKAEAVVTPRIPQDIIDEILDHLVTDSGDGHLRACALVSKSRVPSCRRHLFHTVAFTAASLREWLNTFQGTEESPAHHVRDLRVWIGGGNRVPEKFFEYILWFANMEKISLLGQGGGFRWCEVLRSGD